MIDIKAAMEEELRCIVCKELYVNPVLLPCYHSLCLGCALEIQLQIGNNNTNNSTSTNGNINSTNNNIINSNNNNNNINNNTTNTINAGNTQIVTAQIHAAPVQNQQSSHSSTLPRTNHNTTTLTNGSSSSNSGNGSGGNSSTSDSIASDQDDKVSILSEADSGVICMSRPSSYAGTPNLQALLQFPPTGGAVYSLTCPTCRKCVFFDDAGARNLSRYRTMEAIIDRFCEREALRCQMCEIDPKLATVVCEQCEIRYCETCRELCHPARGPLAKHILTVPRGGVTPARESVCMEHMTDTLSLYCVTCKLALCQQCVGDSRHQSHDIQSIAAICKSQKVSILVN